MSDQNNLSGKIGLDNTDFKTAVSQMNRDIRVIESGFRASAASLGDWGKSADGLNMRMGALTDKIEIQQKKVAVLKSEYQRVSAEKGENSSAAQNLMIKLNRETEALNRSERELRDVDDALAEMGNESEKTGKKTKKMGDDTDEASKKAEKFKKVLKGFGSIGKAAVKALAGVAAAAIAVGGAVVGMVTSTIGPASDLNETISKTQVVFEDQADAVIAFGENAALSLGMSENAALSAAGTYGNLFRSMGIGLDTSADMSMNLIQLAGDLASFNNMDPTEVLDKLRTGISGETEPLKTLGININQVMLQEKAMELGLWDGTGTIDAAAKAQASYALILEQTTLAQGDFERTSDGLANQQRIMNALWENAKATLGTAFLPVVTTGVKLLNEFLQSATFTDGLEMLVGLVEDLSEVIEPLFGGGEIDFEALGEGLAGIGEGIAGAISSLLPTIVTMITTALPVLLTTGITILQGLVDGIVQNLPVLLPAVIDILKMLVKFIAENLPILIMAAFEILVALVNSILDLLPMLVDVALTIIITLANGLIEALPELIPKIVEIVLQIVMTLLDNLPMLIDAAINLMLALIEGLLAALPLLIDMVPEIITTIVSVLIDNLPLIITAAIEIVGALILGLLQAIPDLLLAVVELIESLIEKFKETDWKKIGDDIVAGLKEGFLGKWSDFKDSISLKFSNLGTGIKDFLGINSPSDYFANIGENMAAGLGVGFGDKFDRIKKNIQGAIGSIDQGLGVGGLTLAGQGAGAVYNTTANVYTGPVASDIDYYKLTRMVTDELGRRRK